MSFSSGQAKLLILNWCLKSESSTVFNWPLLLQSVIFQEAASFFFWKSKIVYVLQRNSGKPKQSIISLTSGRKKINS